MDSSHRGFSNYHIKRGEFEIEKKIGKLSLLEADRVSFWGFDRVTAIESKQEDENKKVADL